MITYAAGSVGPFAGEALERTRFTLGTVLRRTTSRDSVGRSVEGRHRAVGLGTKYNRGTAENLAIRHALQ